MALVAAGALDAAAGAEAGAGAHDWLSVARVRFSAHPGALASRNRPWHPGASGWAIGVWAYQDAACTRTAAAAPPV